MERGKEVEKRDWRVSAILTVIWFAAVFFVANQETDIPVSMLIIASGFFIVLIPAMNDLVRSMERAAGRSGRSEEKHR